MSARKLKELQEQLEQKCRELEAAVAHSTELEKIVEGYHARETAIVNALTQAQESAQRIVGDAKVQSSELTADAERRLNEAAEEAERKLNDANTEAERIIIEAKDKAAQHKHEAASEADNLRTAARAEVENCQAALVSVKREIAEAAERAARQAERFKEFLGGVKLSDKVDAEVAPERTEQTEPVTPDDYSTPSELMRSIYAIQGRELPQSANAEPEQPQIEAEPAQEQPEAEPVAQEQEAETAQVQGAEERVWTVDEIMNSELPHEDAPKDALGGEDAIDLDALISDVLNTDK